ncbi:MAG TPA: polysaccharide ABC transporter ATP-binding protein, partial [Chitinophagaceae bacterium]
GEVGTGTISHDLNRWFAKVRGKEDPFSKVGEINDRTVKSDNDYVWALKDINFEVKQGEVLGIIGRNGAGKSTLLKILSKVTTPSTGEIKIKGRIASLLEVGTGFHPELTGKENIFLNGAILGMTKKEIQNKFDEIVDFAGVERYIDTPVKRYSSGMYVRLAFAVAAFLEPEILIVDEVLAVGDTEFQKKCLGRMKQVSTDEGRTILFVSHQINAIKTLCSQGLLLRNGLIHGFGEIQDVVTKYLVSDSDNNSYWNNSNSQYADKLFIPEKFYLTDENLNSLQASVENNEKVAVVIEGQIKQLEPDLTIGFSIYNSEGELIYWSYHTDTAQEKWPQLKVGYNKLVCWLPEHFLNEGEYRLELMTSLHFKEWILQPGVNAPIIYYKIKGGLSESPYWMMGRPGICAPVLKYQIF